MVIISKLCPRDLEEVGKYYEKYTKDLQIKSQSETITGILLMYPKYCVQVIESSIDNITEFVKTMKTDMDTEDGYLEQSKLLVVSHDISLNSNTT
ncbi:hypothetical protein LSAT2_013470 [Lamellibrachia satsuma]|nr:hypothetical protein LSAT2_013470 [Lamellibrachia satsuma]